ncbi:MAG: type II secretion system protein F [Micrococcales bacterium]|nr:MAG: type II secretion system protein F [Micrococcales bacterium]
MGTIVGLLLGAGVFSLWWSWWPREKPLRVPNTLIRKLSEELTQAGLHAVAPSALFGASLVSALSAFLVLYAVSQTTSIALAFAVIAAGVPMAVVRHRARTRRRTTRDLWPEAVDHLVSGVRAGLSLPAALSQLAERGPEELRPAFASFTEDYRATGRFLPSLDRLKDQLADPVADRIIESLRVTREVGGSDLGRTLRTLAEFLRQEAQTRAELEARQSWTVNGARLAVAAPWIVLALLSTRPEAVHAYDSVTGTMVLAFGGAASVLAYLLMVRIGRLRDEPRVLR